MNQIFGRSVATAGDMFFGTISAPVIVVYAYAAVPPSGVLTVDASYCAAHGLAAFDGACIAEALREADEFAGAVGVVEIAPGKPLRLCECPGWG